MTTTKMASDIQHQALPSRPQPGLDFDARLQASRRVDWRFLLPAPKLGAVAHVGLAAGGLAAALRCLSDSLTLIVDPAVHQVPGDLYDVVVTQAPDQLPQAALLVRPGGFLYLEAGGPSDRRRAAWCVRRWKGAASCPAACAAIVRRLGFLGVQTHWHWPDFESCSEIVPLEDSQALGHVFARRGGGSRGAGKFLLRQALWYSGLWVHGVRCFSVLGQCPKN